MKQTRSLLWQAKSTMKGDCLSIDGSTGNIYDGDHSDGRRFDRRQVRHESWAGRTNTASLKVRTNADTPADAKKARELGAEGIGLCRTEHMFFEPEPYSEAFREMICSETVEEREAALEKTASGTAGRL